jgi:hypothetical protein
MKKTSRLRKLIIVAFLTAAVVSSAYFSAKRVLRTKDACTSTGGPLQLTLALAKPEARLHKHYSLWYRLELKNTGCDELYVDARAFAEWSGEISSYPGVVKFRVWGPDGKERFVQHAPETSPSEFGPLSAYKLDLGANPELAAKLAETHRRDARMRADPDLPHFEGEAQMDAEDENVTLLPGESIHTTPAVLDLSFPDRLPGFDLLIENDTPAGQALALNAHQYYEAVWKKMGSPMPPNPVDGYRPFDMFDEFGIFDSPGKYKVQAVFDGSISAEFIYPVFKRLGPRWEWRIRKYDDAFGLDLSPPTKEPVIEHAHAESATIEFEVKRR